MLSSAQKALLGTTFSLFCFGIFVWAIAGYDVYQWHIVAKSWVTTDAEFLQFRRSSRRSHFFGKEALVRYSIQGARNASWVHLSRTDVDVFTSAALSGQMEPTIVVRVKPDDVTQAVADPSSEIHDSIGLGIFCVLLALLLHFFTDRTEAVFKVSFAKDPLGKKEE